MLSLSGVSSSPSEPESEHEPEPGPEPTPMGRVVRCPPGSPRLPRPLLGKKKKGEGRKGGREEGRSESLIK